MAVEEEQPQLAVRERSVDSAVRLAMVIQVSGVALGYGLQFLLARWLGSSEYGVYASVVAWSTALAVFAAAGLPMSALRFIPEYIANGEWASVKGFIRFGYSVSIVLSGAVSLGCAVAMISGHGRQSSQTSFLLLSCFWLVPLLTFSSVQSQICRGFKWIVSAFVFPLVLQPIATVLFVWALGRVLPMTSTVAVYGLCLAVVLSVAFQVVVLAVRLPPPLRSAEVTVDARKWIDVSIPLWIICGFFIILGQLDILMVNLRLGARDAGLYNAATVSSGLVQLGLLAVNSIAAPTYASLYAQGRRGDMQALASRVAHWITWPAVAVLMILCIFGRPILALFGPDFVDAYPSMVILGLGQLVNAASGSVGYLLGLTGHQKESMRVMGWAALTNIVFNLVGISLLGLTGASIGTAVSMALWNLWLYRLVVRYVNVRPSLFDPKRVKAAH